MEEEFNGQHQPDAGGGGGLTPSDTIFSNEPGEMTRVGFTEIDLS